ncbi:HEPN domain-containing protein [Cupriavidus campinensis]
MSRAKTTFEESIKDADELLRHFDAMNANPPPPNAEVLKRAGLIMAMTAWETYVEDRVLEGVTNWLRPVEGSPLAKFVSERLKEELKRFHNPSADKTRRLFLDYLGKDVTAHWMWNNTDAAKARHTLDEWIRRRGDAVHRSRAASAGPSAAHLIKRDELEKAIRFLRSLVDSTDKALETH